MNRLLLLSGILLMSVTALANGSAAVNNRESVYRESIYQAYLENRMDLWKEVMVEMESQLRLDPDPGLRFQLAEAQYGYIAYAISMGNRKEARLVMKKAEKNVNLLLSMDPYDSRAYSLQGAIHGFKVLLDPLRAPLHGRRSNDSNQEAIRIDPSEPRGWMEKANMEFYKPAILGGSVERSVPLYEKAVTLFESTPELTRGNWVYLNCLAGLGLAYEKNGQIAEAGAVYRKLLALEPSFAWIRDRVYPSYQEKHRLF